MNNQEKKEDADCSATCYRRKFRVPQRHHALQFFTLQLWRGSDNLKVKNPKGAVPPRHQKVAPARANPELLTSGGQAQRPVTRKSSQPFTQEGNGLLITHPNTSHLPFNGDRQSSNEVGI